MDDIRLFSAYMKLCGVPTLEAERGEDPRLSGKRLGLVNGGAWVQFWSYYFGRRYLPGVKLVNVSNEAVQLNFMGAHARKEPCPPQSNINLFADYAVQLVELAQVDAVLVTCSTMNRSFDAVQRALAPYGVPAIQIDMPMMEASVRQGGKTLVIATHGPTVENTKDLLLTTASRLGCPQPDFTGATIEDAFHLLGQGRVKEHNAAIAACIEQAVEKDGVEQAVLAQLSMSTLAVEYPDMEKRFGIPVFTSGVQGFERVREILTGV